MRANGPIKTSAVFLLLAVMLVSGCATSGGRGASTGNAGKNPKLVGEERNGKSGPTNGGGKSADTPQPIMESRTPVAAGIREDGTKTGTEYSGDRRIQIVTIRPDGSKKTKEYQHKDGGVSEADTMGDNGGQNVHSPAFKTPSAKFHYPLDWLFDKDSPSPLDWSSNKQSDSPPDWSFRRPSNSALNGPHRGDEPNSSPNHPNSPWYPLTFSVDLH